jgi:hypothetical protein
MKTLLLFAGLLSVCLPAFAFEYEVKPQSFDEWKIVGSTPFRQFDRASVSRATPEQFRAALEAVRAVVTKEAARQTHEANERGGHWIVSDHSPKNKDLNENYQVIEMIQYHPGRKFTPFAVRTRMFGYGPDGNWAWTAYKNLRYLVYVDDDNQVLALKKDDFSGVIDFYEWKLENDAIRERHKKAMRPAGYSTELYESREETAADSASAQ